MRAALFLLILLALSSACFADEPSGTNAEDLQNTLSTIFSSPQPVQIEENGHTQLFLGVLFDAGASPDVMGVSVAVNPKYWLRLSAGILDNMGGGGFRGGITLIPCTQDICPSFTFEGGYVFTSNLNPVIRFVLSNPAFQDDAFNKMEYGYLNAAAGVEISQSRYLTIYFHGGLSYVSATVHGYPPSYPPYITNADGQADAWLPSFKMGAILYFW